MNIGTQTQNVLNCLLEGNTITSFEAFENFGITRLSSIIYSLRKRGYDIETVYDVTTKGKRTKYGIYRLNKGE